MPKKFKDYYDILGLNYDASPEDISNSYRELALKYHPDRSKDTISQFREITEAFSILSDPDKKTLYDLSYSNIDLTQIDSDLIEQIRETCNIHITTEVSLRDIVKDFSKEITISKRHQCACNFSTNCRLCDGTGFDFSEDFLIKIPIMAGIQSGTLIRLAGEGENFGDIVGDLYVKVRVLDDLIFKRKNDDIHRDVYITYPDLVLGTEVEIQDLSYNKIILNIEPCTEPGKTYFFKGMGLPSIMNLFPGDLVITVKLYMPSNISEEHFSVLESLREINE